MIARTVPWWRRALAFALGGIRSGFGLFRRNENREAEEEFAATVLPAAAQPEEKDKTIDQAARSDVRLEAATGGKPIDSAELAAGPKPRNADRVDPDLRRKGERDRALELYGNMTVASAEEEIFEDFEPAQEFAESISSMPRETTQSAAAASAEDRMQCAKIASEAAPEEAAATGAQGTQEEQSNFEGMETSLLQDDPALMAERPSQEEITQLRENTAEEGTAREPAPALESSSIRAEEPVPSEEVTEPIQPAAEAAATPQPAPEPAAAAAEPPAALPPIPAPAAPEPVPVDAVPTLPFTEKTTERTTAEKVAAALKAREARGEDADQSPFSVIVNQVYDGPLDLLLDLIRKQDIDIYDIPIAKITGQFLAYVDRLRASDMDVAGEFIYTAALLIHIKSKMLLPRAPAGPDDAQEDPRRELVERLLEHERFKNAAQMLLEKQMLEAATWTNPGVRDFKEDSEAEPEIAADTTDLVRVFSSILERARNRPILNLEEDTVTVGQMIQFLTRRLTMEDRPVALRRILSQTKSERALIATFLALLELVRLQAILLRQDRHFSEIFIKKHTGFDALMNQGLAEARDDWR